MVSRVVSTTDMIVLAMPWSTMRWISRGCIRSMADLKHHRQRGQGGPQPIGTKETGQLPSSVHL